MDEPGREYPAAVPGLETPALLESDILAEMLADVMDRAAAESKPENEHVGVAVPAINENAPTAPAARNFSRQAPTDLQLRFLTDLSEQTGEAVKDIAWTWRRVASEEITRLLAIHREQRAAVDAAIEQDKAASAAEPHGRAGRGANGTAPAACGADGTAPNDAGNDRYDGPAPADPDRIRNHSLLLIGIVGELAKHLLSRRLPAT